MSLKKEQTHKLYIDSYFKAQDKYTTSIHTGHEKIVVMTKNPTPEDILKAKMIYILRVVSISIPPQQCYFCGVVAIIENGFIGNIEHKADCIIELIKIVLKEVDDAEFEIVSLINQEAERLRRAAA